MNTAGGKTLPKKGRLGSGAYYPNGVPIPGNVFGPNSVVRQRPVPPADRPFGSLSNAGNGTQFGQNRAMLGVGSSHPNSGFHTISQQPKVPAATMDGGTGVFQSPFGVHGTPVIQPQDRHRLHSKKPFDRHFKTVSGASRTLPSDTAFHRVPPQHLPPAPRPPQNYTLNLVRSKAVGPSFVTMNNLWMDPNQSFTNGKINLSGDKGRGRWNTIKRGAAG